MQIKRIQDKKNTKYEKLFDGTLELLYKQTFIYDIDNEQIKINFSDFENNYLSTFSLFSKSVLIKKNLLNIEDKQFFYNEIVEKLKLKSKIPEYNNPDELKYYYVKNTDFSPCFTFKSIKNKYLLFCFGVSELNPGRYVILLQGILEIIN
ncbi:hypothetical protein [uncultured Apibacter sp.]|uniref:hypothetical protein n=1 Tax=uncultured Apibacter sp. TaxID=1778616 RepID=UPI0025F5FDDF|nr:hypothetical protein [uncultured Apibacter sp.]